MVQTVGEREGEGCMTREEKKNALHCLKVMIGEEVCEECDLYGTTGTDHCEADCVRVAIEALEQESKLEKVIKMRDATSEEQKSVDDYIKSISKPTGVNFGALEQEPCEDAISRQAVLDINFKRIILTTAKPAETIEQKVKALSSVNPQPKTGHWIEHPEIETSTPEYLMFYECSECGDKQCFCKSDIHKKHFCNNCGAKMVEPQKSEE